MFSRTTNQRMYRRPFPSLLMKLFVVVHLLWTFCEARLPENPSSYKDEEEAYKFIELDEPTRMEGLKLAETLGFNATAKAETLAIEALQNLYHMARANMIAQRALKNEYPHKKFHPGLRRSDKVEGDDATAEDKPPLKEQLVDSAESDEKGNVQLRDPNTPAAPAQPSPAPAAPNQPSPNTPAAAAQASPNIAPAAPVVPPTPKSVSYECAFCEGTTEAFDKQLSVVDTFAEKVFKSDCHRRMSSIGQLTAQCDIPINLVKYSTAVARKLIADRSIMCEKLSNSCTDNSRIVQIITNKKVPCGLCSLVINAIKPIEPVLTAIRSQMVCNPTDFLCGVIQLFGNQLIAMILGPDSAGATSSFCIVLGCEQE